MVLEAATQRRRRLSRVLALASSAALACPSPAGAAKLRLGAEPYQYVILDQDLRVLLREFGANLGVRVNVGESVQGRVKGRLPPLPPQQFLDKLAASYGFDWYFDGYDIEVSASSDAVSKVMSLGGVPFARLRASLEALEVSDDRYQVRPHPQPDLVLVAGPPRFVELVDQTLAALAAERAPGAERPRAEAAGEPPRPVAAGRGAIVVYRGASVTRVPLESD